MSDQPFILASRSKARTMLLANAGLTFGAEPADIDERALEKPLLEKGASPQEIALALACEKAKAVSCAFPESFVLGADQTLGQGNERFNKTTRLKDAHAQLSKLAGKTHMLCSALALAKGGEIIWTYEDEAHMSMRALSSDAIDAYLAQIGDKALGSVGCYQLEGPGIQLFEAIKGDYFTILGLPLLPLLSELKSKLSKKEAEKTGLIA